jgi:hypothetical protein
MVLGDKILERDGDRLVEAAGLRGAEHGRRQGEGMILLGTVPSVIVRPMS